MRKEYRQARKKHADALLSQKKPVGDGRGLGQCDWPPKTELAAYWRNRKKNTPRGLDATKNAQ